MRGWEPKFLSDTAFLDDIIIVFDLENDFRGCRGTASDGVQRGILDEVFPDIRLMYMRFPTT